MHWSVIGFSRVISTNVQFLPCMFALEVTPLCDSSVLGASRKPGTVIGAKKMKICFVLQIVQS